MRPLTNGDLVEPIGNQSIAQNKNAIKPKNKKFKKLLDVTFNMLMAYTACYYMAGYDKVIPESVEAKIFWCIPVTEPEKEIEQSFAKNYEFLLREFKGNPDIKQIENLKIRTRMSFSVTNFLDINTSPHSVPLFNYINVPIPAIEEDYQRNVKIKNIVSSNLAQGIPASQTIKSHLSKPESTTLVSSFFLNFSDGDKALVPDFYYFHEFAHTFFDNALEPIEDAIKKDLKAHSIDYSRNNDRILDESMSDVIGAIFTIEKHNLDQARAVFFIEAIMAHRFVTRRIVQSVTDDEVKHNTEFALYSLLTDIKKMGLEKFKEQTIDEKISLALGYAKKSVYYSNYTTQERIREVSDSQANALAKFVFSSKQIEDSFDSIELFMGTNLAINKIAQNKSYVVKNAVEKDSDDNIKPGNVSTVSHTSKAPGKNK